MRKFIFNLLIALDHLLNVIFLGDIATTLSTRAYIQSSMLKNKKWDKWEKLIDFIFFDEKHCLESFAWELNRNIDWINKYK